LSIKNSLQIKKLLSKYIVFILSMVSFCIMPCSSYSWFASPAETKDDAKPPGLATHSSIPDISSSTYVLPYNTLGDNHGSVIFPSSGRDAGVVAGHINIDVSLITLSQKSIDPDESIDRLLSANLRIQNILDEYLSLKKRTGLKSSVIGGGREGKKFKRDIENIARHGAGYTSKNYGEIEQSAAAMQQISQDRAGGKAGQSRGNSDAMGSVAGLGNQQKLPAP